jgi:putative endonuclease
MKQMDKRTDKRKLGDQGEKLVSEYLEHKDFKILERNYLRKWGELDIVAVKNGVIHFIEVKSVSRESCDGDVNHETSDSYRPEDNVHPWKAKRLRRVIQTYLLECSGSDGELEWQFDLAVVFLGESSYRITVEEDLII